MEKRGVIILIASFLLIISIAGFFLLNKNENNGDKSLPSQSSFSEEARTLIHKDFKATISSGWNETEISPSIFVYLPPGANPDDASTETIIITDSFFEENNLTLDQLLEKGIENSKATMPDLEIIENSEWKNHFFSGKEIKFTGTQDGIKRQFTQIYGIKYNTLYSITYSCAENNCKYNYVFNNLTVSFEPTIPK